MMLSDLGADIIKVENSTNPDMTRFIPPMVDDISAIYLHLNRGKRSLSMNLKAEGATEVIYRLVEEYDVVIEQFRPGTMEKFGIGYDRLKEINESLIYCSLTGYGQTGSFRDRAGHDINYLALGGLESYSGRGETGPVLSGMQIADIASGSKNVIIGILAAYIRRQNSGLGDYIDVSMTDGVFSMTIFSTAGFLADGREPQRESELLNGGTLYDYYTTADNGYISVGSIEEKFFRVFCGGIGRPDLAGQGIMNAKAKEEIGRIIKEKPLAHWKERFSKLDACVEPVCSISEAVQNPPLSERNMVVSVETASGMSVRQMGNPIKYASGDYYAKTAGVSLGYHNDEILSSLNYSKSDCERLKADGCVG
jgi:crotonobetainyl-CoA:carnitine CoA-transferase CaiB-like acyl-CoA transferase